jgi:SAM-dependent methyltransferase
MSDRDAARYMMQMTSGLFTSRALMDIADLKIADSLDDDPLSAEEIASRTATSPIAIRRTLRLLASLGIFRQENDGRFSHTVTSRLLRSDNPQSIRAYAAATFSWTVFADFGRTLKTGRPVQAAQGPGGYFTHLMNHPDVAKVFDDAMTCKSNYDIEPLLMAYDFSRYATLVDVGGGQGLLMKRILESAPASAGIIFDLPHTLNSFVSRIEGDRLKLQAGDFFKDDLPVGDAYLLMNVLHNWSDEESEKILSAVRRVSKKDTRLLIIESILPERAEPDQQGLNRAILLDFVMLAVSHGSERTLPQYTKLLANAGFNVQRRIDTHGDLSLIECIPN